MFEEVTVQKNASKIEEFYHPDFLLYANGHTMDYQDFYERHQDIYATPIQYHVAYQEETFLESEDKVAGRMWITTQLPGKPKRELELLIIVQYKEGKIYRVWELTFPDWSKMPDFEVIQKNLG